MRKEHFFIKSGKCLRDFIDSSTLFHSFYTSFVIPVIFED